MPLPSVSRWVAVHFWILLSTSALKDSNATWKPPEPRWKKHRMNLQLGSLLLIGAQQRPLSALYTLDANTSELIIVNFNTSNINFLLNRFVYPATLLTLRYGMTHALCSLQFHYFEFYLRLLRKLILFVGKLHPITFSYHLLLLNMQLLHYKF